uniref:Uncharacterized protein n=1 Tax=Anopheles culicifacies TaxID=139723 RepID=A0A182MHY3_9DIPT
MPRARLTEVCVACGLREGYDDVLAPSSFERRRRRRRRLCGIMHRIARAQGVFRVINGSKSRSLATETEPFEHVQTELSRQIRVSDHHQRRTRHSEQHHHHQPPPSVCYAAPDDGDSGPIAAAPKTASKFETMAEAQRLIGISLAKIAQSRVCRGGVSLHKNLLVATVLQKARYIFMEEAYHIVHGHYLQQQQQQQQHHHQLMQEQQNAAYLLAGHCDSSSNDGCDDDCGNNKCSEMDDKHQQHLSAIGNAQEDELVDPVEEDETTSASGDGVTRESLSYDCDSTILPTTIGGLPLEPLNMCRNGGGSSNTCTEEDDEEEETVNGGDDEDKQTSPPHDVSHLFLLPALAPWIGASEDKENVSSGGSFPFLPSVAHSPFDEEEDEEEAEEEEDDEEENTCQDLSCHQRKPEVVEEQTPELVKQFESAVRSKGAMRYFDLDDRRTVGRPERRRRRHRTEGDHHHQQPMDNGVTSSPAKRRRSSATDEVAVDHVTANSTTPVEDDDRILPIALLSAKRLKTCDTQRPLASAICSSSSHSTTNPPQFYSSPHETICTGDAETLSECVNQQLEAENLTTTNLPPASKSPELPTTDASELPDTDAPPTPSVESIDRITSLVSIFSFGNLSRSVSTPDFCAAQAQKDSRPDAGGSLLTSQLQHHGQRGYLTMTV